MESWRKADPLARAIFIIVFVVSVIITTGLMIAVNNAMTAPVTTEQVVIKEVPTPSWVPQSYTLNPAP